MHLLAIETATEACSVALVCGDSIVARHELAPRRHAELVLPMIDGVLAEAGLARGAIDAIAVGRGPGAFTGVRLAISVAQGLALGLDRPVVPISTLAALALEASVESTTRDEASTVGGAEAPTAPPDLIIAALDARMGEVYAACFEADAEGLVTAITEEAVCEASRCVVPARDAYIGAGSGWAAYRTALESCLARPPRLVLPDLLPRATSIARLALRELALAHTVDAAHAQPVYLRDKVALTVAEQSALKAAR
ncbi:MAG TPA: tRNA (adenosine(37)-N6)-threonylcarbamoyltransferase complex dimerization subunit type 1 TsaB [Xanthomonadales bacterium]|nr:tRNA (adenosine(37)-N6)-threonylcarbamoyltransferase complex dimerization subunit type 1 TsaB [Xanthomonadales bacterium]